MGKEGKWKGNLKLLQGRGKRKGSEYMKGVQMSKELGGEERAAALGTGVPWIAESAFSLVGQCMCVEVVQYYCFYVCFFVIEWI